jgi:hypothetical protein
MASTQKILAELVDHITGKQNLYRSCYSADLKRLEIVHGTTVITEALRLVERNAHIDGDAWDRRGHAMTVSRAIDRLLIRRAEDPDSFSDDVKV